MPPPLIQWPWLLLWALTVGFGFTVGAAIATGIVNLLRRT